MLVDFSDVCDYSVREIGQVYMRLVMALHFESVVDVPVVDPSLFMERFASRLELGEQTSTVAQTAIRLVQQMKRDWLNDGRRPTGLCGAALLVACKFHGVEKSPDEVARVVKMAESTLQARL